MTVTRLALALLLGAAAPVDAADPPAESALYRAQIAAASAHLRLDEAGVARAWLAATPSAARGWEWGHLAGESDASYFRLLGHEGPVQALAFSADGKRIASAGRDRTVRLWDVAARKELAVLRGHEGEVLAVAFSPDGRQLASASRDTTIRIWDSASGATRMTLTGHSQAIGAVTWSRDGQTLASGSYRRNAKGAARPTDGILRLWNATTGALIRFRRSSPMAMRRWSRSTSIPKANACLRARGIRR